MDLNTVSDLLNYLTGLPIYVWIIVAIILVIIFGDREIWEYEVNFAGSDHTRDSEIEIECYKRKGAFIEASLIVEAQHNNKPIEIYNNGTVICTIPASKNNSERVRYKEKYTLSEPTQGSAIEVKVMGQILYSGQLVKD